MRLMLWLISSIRFMMVVQEKRGRSLFTTTYTGITKGILLTLSTKSQPDVRPSACLCNTGNDFQVTTVTFVIGSSHHRTSTRRSSWSPPSSRPLLSRPPALPPSLSVSFVSSIYWSIFLFRLKSGFDRFNNRRAPKEQSNKLRKTKIRLI